MINKFVFINFKHPVAITFDITKEHPVFFTVQRSCIYSNGASNFFTVKPTDALISKFIWYENIHVSDSFSAYHQEFSTTHSTLAQVTHV